LLAAVVLAVIAEVAAALVVLELQVVLEFL
jgi:hypothetical protein